MGYEPGFRAYRIWDLGDKKVRVISYNFCVFSEGFFPFKNRSRWPDKPEVFPKYFFPTFEAFMDREEWRRFDFSEGEEKEIIAEKVFHRPTPTTHPLSPPGPFSSILSTPPPTGPSISAGSAGRGSRDSVFGGVGTGEDDKWFGF